jgi:hypothetical protein
MFDLCYVRSRDSSVGIATGYGLNRRNSNPGKDKIFLFYTTSYAVGIATSYGLDDRGVGVRVRIGSRIISSPRRLGCPPNLLSNGYRG